MSHVISFIIHSSKISTNNININDFVLDKEFFKDFVPNVILVVDEKESYFKDNVIGRIIGRNKISINKTIFEFIFNEETNKYNYIRNSTDKEDGYCLRLSAIIAFYPRNKYMWDYLIYFKKDANNIIQLTNRSRVFTANNEKDIKRYIIMHNSKARYWLAHQFGFIWIEDICCHYEN